MMHIKAVQDSLLRTQVGFDLRSNDRFEPLEVARSAYGQLALTVGLYMPLIRVYDYVGCSGAASKSTMSAPTYLHLCLFSTLILDL